jgi:hypothetical protein
MEVVGGDWSVLQFGCGSWWCSATFTVLLMWLSRDCGLILVVADVLHWLGSGCWWLCCLCVLSDLMVLELWIVTEGGYVFSVIGRLT